MIKHVLKVAVITSLSIILYSIVNVIPLDVKIANTTLVLILFAKLSTI